MKKNLLILFCLVLTALSLGYGLGRDMEWRKLKMQGLFTEPQANAASAEAKAELANIFVQISKKMIPSVVNIFTTARVKGMGPGGREGGPDDLWRRFFEDFFGEQFGASPNGNGGGGQPPRGMPAPKAQALGTGFIIEASNSGGLILTNNHVVEGADEIFVRFTEAVDEKDTAAEVIGRDPDLDVAILKVKTHRKLSAAILSNSDNLEVGEWVAALGNPFGHGHSVTHGILSAKERALPGGFGKYLQVDAPINPGNSGGPLVNLNGEVIGINNAIDARGPGIGFAIPINQIKAVLPQLKEKGKVDRGYIGVSVDDLRPDLAKSLKLDESLKAPIITNVLPGQPAHKAGLQAYDVITEVNGRKVYTSPDLVSEITSVPVGQVAKLKILRSGAEKTVDVRVTLKPDFRKGLTKPGKKDKRPHKINTGIEVNDVDLEDAKRLSLSEKFKGVVVTAIEPGSAAFQEGLVRDDIILEVDQKSIRSADDFYRIVNSKKTYLLRVRRIDDAGQEMFVVITLNLAANESE